jgi:hypothetical protein
MTRIKTIRRALCVGAATAALALIAAVTAAPAYAYGGINLRMVYGNGPCLRPDSNALGSLVHANSCDSNSNGWYPIYRSTEDFRLEWLGNGGCLIPNHDALGQPVVVTNGNNGTVCDRPDAWWHLTYIYNTGHYYITNDSDGLALDYDISGAYRGLQLWNSIPSNTNQQFFFS